LKQRIVSEILPVVLGDNVKARRLRSDGSYERILAAAARPVRSQVVLQELARRPRPERLELVRKLLEARTTRPKEEASEAVTSDRVITIGDAF
jgi:hypothetical protein